MPNRKNCGILICVGERYEILKHPIRGSVGTGRRARLRILWWLHRVGSSPIFRTKDSSRKTWVFLRYRENSDKCEVLWWLAWWYWNRWIGIWTCILRKISCEMSHGEKEARVRWTPEDRVVFGVWGKSGRKRDRNLRQIIFMKDDRRRCLVRYSCRDHCMISLRWGLLWRWFLWRISAVPWDRI